MRNLNKKALFIVITEVLWNFAKALNLTTNTYCGTAENIFVSNDSDNWWQVHTQPDQSIFVRSVDLDEGHIHSCYEYKAINSLGRIISFDTFCYPSVIVTGVRKCSTSALFSLFALHPKAKRSVQKENCAFIGDRSLLQYFDSLPRNVELDEMIIDGCVDLQGNMKIRKMLRYPKTFFVILVRDFTDWLWSAYNYWCDPGIDKYQCSPENKWVNVEFHFRSVNGFHDIVQGSINGTAIASPLQMKEPCKSAMNFYFNYFVRLFAEVPANQAIILASEDLEKRPSEVWHRLALAIGLDPIHPRMKEFESVRYNTQVSWGSKGENSKISKSAYKSGLYQVSKFQPVMESTRKLLDSCWQNDCLLVTLLTGYHYDACAEVYANITNLNGKDEKRVAQFIFRNRSANQYGATGNISASLMQYMNVTNQRLQGVDIPFFQRNIHRCLNMFSKRIETNLSFVTSPIYSMSSINGEDLKFVSVPNAVLILSLSDSDRNYMRNILRFGADFQVSLDVNDVNDEGRSINLRPDSCLGGNPILVSSSPSNIRRLQRNSSQLISSDNNAANYWRLLNSSLITCGGHHIAFSRILVLMKDTMGLVWSKYKKSLGYSIGIKDADFIFFNWTHWESTALSMLTELHSAVDSSNVSTSVAGQSRSDFWSAKENALFLESTFSTKIKVVIVEDIVFSPSKMKLAFDIIQFIVNSTIGDAVLHNSTVSLNSLSCAHVLATHFKNHSKSHGAVSKANIDLAYASESLICAVRDYYRESPLQLSTLSIPPQFASSTSCSARGSDRNSTKDDTYQERFSLKCKLRYSRKTFIQKVRFHPAVLLASPGLESVNIRLLVEHSTGIYSGAMETNSTLVDLLHGEGFCGQRLSIVQANPVDVTIKFSRTGHGVVSLTNTGKKKCMKGLIRGFADAVLLVRDPFMHVWSTFLNITSAQLPQHQQRNNTRNLLLQLAMNYSVQDLQVSHAYERLHTYFRFNEANVLIISYESLIDPIHQHRTTAFATLLRFLHFPSTFSERRACAHQFLESSQSVSEISKMHDFFLLEENRNTLCEMNQLFMNVLYAREFNFTRLYTTLQC